MARVLIRWASLRGHLMLSINGIKFPISLVIRVALTSLLFVYNERSVTSTFQRLESYETGNQCYLRPNDYKSYFHSFVFYISFINNSKVEGYLISTLKILHLNKECYQSINQQYITSLSKLNTTLCSSNWSNGLK
jgi:hypothetical protein